MGDAEKKLLADSAETENEPVCGGFQLHCFPDITGEARRVGRMPDSDGRCFQRSVPGSGDCNFGPVAADLKDAYAGMTPEEADQRGYERGFCEGEKKGRAEGETAGVEKGRLAVQPVIDTLQALLGELSRMREQTLHQLEAEIVALAMSIARKIVTYELELSPELVVKVIRQALSHLEPAGLIQIKLNPEDVKRLEEINENLLADLAGPAAISIESEPTISCGGCIIETDAGSIDARLETQFQAIEEAFQAAMSTDRNKR